MLRKDLIARLGRENPRILDAYCGPGTMWRRAYAETTNYLGLDRTPYDDERRTIVCDDTRFLRLRGLDLDQFDIFDLDAFGSPAYPLAIICRRLRWTRVQSVGVLLTDGTGFNAKMNSVGSSLLRYIGLERHRGATIHHEHRADVLSMLIRRTCAEAGAVPLDVRRTSKQNKGNEMWYVSYVMRRAETLSTRDHRA